jgi:hypothetical protein
MSGALQAVFQNQRSFGPPAPSAIGAAYGGGYYAGSISTAGNGVADYYLVVGPASSAISTGIRFKTTDDNDAGATSVINGPSNSASMNNAAHPAAQFCEGLSIGGFSDWYMPAENELEVCYYNLKPSTDSNITSGSTNANSVPARTSNYTSGTPAQTSATVFQVGGAEAYNSTNTTACFYWNSTQRSAVFGDIKGFKYGQKNYGNKTSQQYSVRAIRRVAL